jgi:hypothetical protein
MAIASVVCASQLIELNLQQITNVWGMKKFTVHKIYQAFVFLFI